MSHDSSKNPRVIVGMSGGVDSSVSAYLLLQQGYRVEGLFMKNWDEDDDTQYCTAKADYADAQAVCDKLEITLHGANFAAEYWDNVFEHFLHEYRAGRTPNPDVLCNREIKFKAFLDYALMLGADYIATGHYVRKQVEDGQTQLLKGTDGNKDQSYFLCNVSAKQLARTLFPIGSLIKSDVRKLASRNGLATHDKKDSTGICFIGERRFRDFLETYIPAKPGLIETPEGEVLGEHKGLMYHTLGQRQGLGIGGVSGTGESPWYVAGKDMERNVLIVVQGNDHPMLFSSRLFVSHMDWVNEPAPSFPLPCHAKIRYRQKDQACVVKQAPEGGFDIEFSEPQRAITPGQYLVLYQQDICLGGGVIEQYYQ